MKKQVSIFKPTTIKTNDTLGEFVKQHPNDPFPGKLEITKNALGVVVTLDGQPVGRLGTISPEGAFARYADNDLMFDDKGKCTSAYDIVARGTDKLGNIAAELTIHEVTKAETVSTKCNLSSFEDEIKRIEDEGIEVRPYTEAAVDLMIKNEVAEEIIRAVLKTWKKSDIPLGILKTMYTPVNKEKYMEDILLQVLDGESMVLEGGQSTGKTLMTRCIAFVMHKPYFLVTFSDDMTKSDLFGEKTTNNAPSNMITMDLITKARSGDFDAQSQLEYLKAKCGAVQIVVDYAELPEALEHKGVLSLNELNLGPASLVAGFLNQILDGTGFIAIPGRGRIKVDPEFVCIATQNPPEYVGVQEQNGATMSRMGFLSFGFPDSVKKPITAGLAGLTPDPNQLNQVDKLYKELLKAWQDHAISDRALNIRGFVRAFEKVIKYGADLKKQIMIQVVNACPPADQQVIKGKMKLYFT